MFKVQPVRLPELQDKIADALGGKKIENTYSFFAGEMEADFTTVKYPIALCRFTLTPQKAVIKALDIAKGSEKDEAVTVLIRAVMSWVNRAGVPLIEFEDGAADDNFIKSVSFRRNDSGIWEVNLDKFYKSPCHYNKDK